MAALDLEQKGVPLPSLHKFTNSIRSRPRREYLGLGAVIFCLLALYYGGRTLYAGDFV